MARACGLSDATVITAVSSESAESVVCKHRQGYCRHLECGDIKTKNVFCVTSGLSRWLSLLTTEV